jgi:hypothetical protein
MLKWDPAARISARESLNHPFFKDLVAKKDHYPQQHPPMSRELATVQKI